MDPFVTIDCQQVLPNRFALALAAAARSRALRRGAKPRLARPAAKASEVALHEIAGRALARDELAPFLIGSNGLELLPSPASEQKLCDGDFASGAAASVSRRGKRPLMMQPIQQEKEHGEATDSR